MIYLELFYTFLMIGALTFGGGYAMLPMIQEQVAARWGGKIPGDTLLNFVAVSESTPGPFAINMATYVGSVMGGEMILENIFGSFCATMGVVVPSFVIILIVARCYDQFKENRIVKGCMSGLKPAAVGMIGAAVIKAVGDALVPKDATWASAVVTPDFYVSIGIFALTCFLAFRKKLHPIWLILLSAAIGIAWGYLSPLMGITI